MDLRDTLDSIESCQMHINYWQAQQMRALADYVIATEGDEFASAEIAAMMRWTSRYCDDQLQIALDLVTRLPRTVEALEHGLIDLYKAKIIHEKTLPLSVEHAAEVEQRVLDKAPDQTSTQLRRRATRTVMAVDPVGARERIAAKKAERAAGKQNLEDDMAKLWLCLSADKAMAIAHRVDKIAKGLEKVPGDDRTLNQLRADVVTDLLLATPDNASCVKVNLNVTVSATTLMGLDDHPGELDGYGPISADLARELAGDATWRRLLTDPASGQLLDVGTTTYRPPAHLRRFLWARDQTCRFPGCMMPATRSELDHTVPFPEGSTSEVNLGSYCKHHHRCKHRSAWQVSQPAPGRFVFTSPAGRTYVREPEPVLPAFQDAAPF